MNLTFVELTPFSKYRSEFMTDEEYRLIQNELLENPEKGDVIQGLHGLRKVRIADNSRNKGKRGGARVVYLYTVVRNRIYLITAYGKGKKTDLSNEERKILKQLAQALSNE